jgi:hypothetical protein
MGTGAQDVCYLSPVSLVAFRMRRLDAGPAALQQPACPLEQLLDGILRFTHPLIRGALMLERLAELRLNGTKLLQVLWLVHGGFRS